MYERYSMPTIPLRCVVEQSKTTHCPMGRTCVTNFPNKAIIQASELALDTRQSYIKTKIEQPNRSNQTHR